MRGPPRARWARHWPVSHYGPVPRFRADGWNLQVFGPTATGGTYSWTFDEVMALPATTITADHEFDGVPAAVLLGLAPPAPDVTHVMAWAEYGYPWTGRRHSYQEDDDG
ncbi:molybdopterin-binding protein [Streptomyces erythrochromogenes]|uniref:hypothetical protein n=1 Tax=Streptomyces erythrochromogenes TaxID=285574 RepID=UPI0036C9C36C